MSETLAINCPVCATQHNDPTLQFCGNCGWEYFSLALPDNSTMQEYYQLRLTQHQRLYDRLKTKMEEREQLLNEYIKIQSELTALEEQAGHMWIGVGVPQLTAKVVNWEQIAPLKLRINGTDLRSLLNDRLILLLKKGSRPMGNGDFEHALTIRTDSMRTINSNTEELTIPAGSLPPGDYFLRIISMPCKSHQPLFFHKEQAQQPSFDWRKTIIAL